MGLLLLLLLLVLLLLLSALLLLLVQLRLRHSIHLLTVGGSTLVLTILHVSAGEDLLLLGLVWHDLIHCIGCSAARGALSLCY